MPEEPKTPIAEHVFDSAVQDIDERMRLVDTSLFEFMPVSLERFIRDKNLLGLPPLSPKQLEAVEISTQIYFPATLKQLGWKKRRYVHEVVLL